MEPTVYTYPLTATANGSVDNIAFDAELRAAGLGARTHFTIGVDSLIVEFADTLSPADKSRLDTTVATHVGLGEPLALAKRAKISGIVQKTAILIAASTFEYGGKRFSMTMTDQLNTLGAFNSRNDPSFEYPVARFTFDNTDSVALADADAVAAFYGATLAAVRAVRDGGAALKARVNAATTVTQVEAIEDSR